MNELLMGAHTYAPTGTFEDKIAKAAHHYWEVFRKPPDIVACNGKEPGYQSLVTVPDIGYDITVMRDGKFLPIGHFAGGRYHKTP